MSSMPSRTPDATGLHLTVTKNVACAGALLHGCGRSGSTGINGDREDVAPTAARLNMNIQEHLDIDEIRKQVFEHGFSIVRPPGFEELCYRARQDYLDALQAVKIQPPKKPFHYSDLARAPWRKLAIGSRTGASEAYPQFLQTIYFDCDKSSYVHLNELFKSVIELRNRLMNVSSSFGEDPVGDQFWNACRVHHYPAGGSFMVMHRDTYFPARMGEYAFYQLLVPLSKKGEHFTSGGGVMVDKSGNKIDTDELVGMSGILVFDGRTQHGVEDVDPDQILDFESPKGRLAAVCNLYVTPPVK
jgi:hypothetical protein